MINIQTLGRKSADGNSRQIAISGENGALTKINKKKSDYDKKVIELEATKQKDATNIGTIGGILSGMAGLIFGPVGLLIGSAATGIATNIRSTGLNSSKLEAQRLAGAYGGLSDSYGKYIEALNDRDRLLSQGMDSINYTLSQMGLEYGNGFVNTLYNFYLAQSGITPDSYSMLSNNFRTFENIGYGSQAEESSSVVNPQYNTIEELKDSLPFYDLDTAKDSFSNVYRNLTIGDMDPIRDLLSRQLYGANTQFSMNLQGLETEVQETINLATMGNRQQLESAVATLEANHDSAVMDDISAELSIGDAQSARATSGLRNGTSGNNENLARLQKDANTIQRMAQTTSLIIGLRQQIEQSNASASSSAFARRQQQKQMVQGALESSINSQNQIGQFAQTTESDANEFMAESDIAKTEAQRYIDEINNGYNEEDDESSDNPVVDAADNAVYGTGLWINGEEVSEEEWMAQGFTIESDDEDIDVTIDPTPLSNEEKRNLLNGPGFDRVESVEYGLEGMSTAPRRNYTERNGR